MEQPANQMDQDEINMTFEFIDRATGLLIEAESRVAELQKVIADLWATIGPTT